MIYCKNCTNVFWFVGFKYLIQSLAQKVLLEGRSTEITTHPIPTHSVRHKAFIAFCPGLDYTSGEAPSRRKPSFDLLNSMIIDLVECLNNGAVCIHLVLIQHRSSYMGINLENHTKQMFMCEFRCT